MKIKSAFTIIKRPDSSLLFIVKHNDLPPKELDKLHASMKAGLKLKENDALIIIPSSISLEFIKI